MKATAHEHCWHVQSSVTNGLAVKGYYKETCCHCGAKAERPWKQESDDRHGPFCYIMVTVFAPRQIVQGAEPKP